MNLNLNEKEISIISYLHLERYSVERISSILKIPNSQILKYVREDKYHPVENFVKVYKQNILKSFYAGTSRNKMSSIFGIRKTFIDGALILCGVMDRYTDESSGTYPIILTTDIVNRFRDVYCLIGNEYIIKSPYDQYATLDYPEFSKIKILKKYPHFAQTTKGSINYVDILQGLRYM